MTDLHSVHSSSMTALFAHSTLDPKLVEVPGPKRKAKKGKSLDIWDLSHSDTKH